MVKAKDHEACRASSCCICYLEYGSKEFRPISQETERLVKKHVAPEYSRFDLNYPTKLCKQCHSALWDREKRGAVYGLHKSEFFGTKIPRCPPHTKCDCIICHRSRLNGQDWKAFIKCQKEKRKAVSGETSAPAPPGDDAPKCPDCLSPVR